MPKRYLPAGREGYANRGESVKGRPNILGHTTRLEIRLDAATRALIDSICDAEERRTGERPTASWAVRWAVREAVNKKRC